MAGVSREKRLADSLANNLDTTADLNMAHVAECLAQHGSGVHRNFFDMVLAVLYRYSFEYQAGGFREDDPMYTMAEQSAIMMEALTVAPSTGRHAAE